MGSSCAGLAIPPAPRQQYGLKLPSLVEARTGIVDSKAY